MELLVREVLLQVAQQVEAVVVQVQ